MARLLENQAKELLREANTMAGGDVEGFAAVAFPIVRRVFAGLIANDLVSVQPMSLPSGLIFFLDFTFSGDLAGDSSGQTNRGGNLKGESIYGTDRVGSQVTGGVNLLGQYANDLSGPRTATARGYAYASPTGSGAVAWTNVGQVALDSVSDEFKKTYLQFDPDVIALSGSGTSAVAIVKTALSNMDQFSANNTAPVVIPTPGDLNGVGADAAQVRRLSQVIGSELYLVFVGDDSATGIATGSAVSGTVTTQWPQGDDFTEGTGLGSVAGREVWGLEGNADIPEIDIKVEEVELTSLLSEQIALEIDREILADLVNGATAATRYWSRAPGLFVDSQGNEIGASVKAPDFTGTVSEWYETLVETINDVSAQIHRKTLRGGANFVVCGPEVANILEFTAGFRAAVTHDDEKGSIGALRTGSLSKKFDVIVDPYFLRNVILVGRRGGSFLESGYVYAPYVPLQTTPTIFGPEDFVPRKGVMTRYAKKMVRPDMYGLVVVRGLLGESGA
jgi:hypothetical protein